MEFYEKYLGDNKQLNAVEGENIDNMQATYDQEGGGINVLLKKITEKIHQNLRLIIKFY